MFSTRTESGPFIWIYSVSLTIRLEVTQRPKTLRFCVVRLAWLDAKFGWEKQQMCTEFWPGNWKSGDFCEVTFLSNVKQEHGGCVISVFSFRFSGDNAWPIRDKFGYEWAFTNMATVQKFEVMSDGYNLHGLCSTNTIIIIIIIVFKVFEVAGNK